MCSFFGWGIVLFTFIFQALDTFVGGSVSYPILTDVKNIRQVDFVVFSTTECLILNKIRPYGN